MTCVIHHGNPGSFKTFALVQREIPKALEEGRTVITNIRGIESIEAFENALKINAHPQAQLIAIPHDKEGFDTIGRFFQWAPPGALIIIDEAQRVYRSNEKLDKFNWIPPDDSERSSFVADAFDKHRHFNWDIYLSTTHIDKVHKEIRQVVEWAYLHRNLSNVLPWYKNTWKEFRHDPESNGKQVSRIDGTPKQYKADSKVFNCYQSTATGKAKGSSVNRSVFADPRLQFLGLFLVFLITFFIYKINVFFNLREERLNSHHSISFQETIQPALPIPDANDNNVLDSSLSQNSTDLGPLKDLDIFYSHNINGMDYYKIVHKNNTYVFFDYIEITSMGYELLKYKECFSVLSYQGNTQIISCDAPDPQYVDTDIKPQNTIL